jgi:hypothetical protein
MLPLGLPAPLPGFPVGLVPICVDAGVDLVVGTDVPFCDEIRVGYTVDVYVLLSQKCCVETIEPS